MSKQQRKRTAKRRKLEKNEVARGATSLPPAARSLVDHLERLSAYLPGPGDLEAGVSLARRRVGELVSKIAVALAPHDAFDVLEALRIRSMMVNPETYTESEHGGTGPAIELAALILAARGGRAGVTLPPGGDEGPSPAVLIESLWVDLRALMDAGQMLTMFGADREDPLHRLSMGSRLREAGVRNTSYNHMVQDTLVALFDEPAVQALCSSALGCTVAEIRAVFAALHELVAAQFASRHSAMEEIADLAAGGAVELQEADLERARVLLERATERPAAIGTRSADSIAAQAGLGIDTVRSVLALFSTPLVARPAADTVLDFFEGTSPYRTHPILATAEGEYLAVHHALLTPAIRERVEDALRGRQAAWDTYSKHRGTYLETEAVNLLAAHLPGCDKHLGFEYFIPANSTETTPSDYTKLVEGDGLLLVDDIAIVLEAKAVALRPRSRTGEPLRLRQDLRRIVTDAADQADRLRDRILGDRGLRLRDNTWLDLGMIREVHTIAVSLEDLSGIATVTSDLVVAGLLGTARLPWTVSLHDLRIISELVDRPAELLLYIRRRTEPDTTRRFHAVDELDFFLHFFAAQLYVEPDPDEVHRAFPQLTEPRTKNRRRYRARTLEQLASRTDPLDAWYFHRLNLRTTPAEKPQMKADSQLLQLIDKLTARQDPGWLSTTATLLGFDDTTQRRCAITGSRLASRTRTDGLPHSQAMPVGSLPDGGSLLVWLTKTPGASLAAAQRLLRDYTSAKKHQLQLERGFGLLYDEYGQLLDTCYDNRPPKPNPVMDVLGAQMGLKGPEAFQSVPPPKKKPSKHRRPKRSLSDTQR